MEMKEVKREVRSPGQNDASWLVCLVLLEVVQWFALSLVRAEQVSVDSRVER